MPTCRNPLIISDVLPSTLEKILDRLKRENMMVEGNNPWMVDTHKSRIRLEVQYDMDSCRLTIKIIRGIFSPPCGVIKRIIKRLFKDLKESEDILDS